MLAVLHCQITELSESLSSVFPPPISHTLYCTITEHHLPVKKTCGAACSDLGICSPGPLCNLASASHHAERKASIMLPHPLIIEF